MNVKNYVKLGRIYREHGVKGYCKFYAYGGSDDNLVVGRKYRLERNDGVKKTVTIRDVEPFKRYYLVHFDVFKMPEEIIPWRKAKLLMDTEKLIRSGNEMYDFEWEGFEVLDAHHKHIGTIQRVIRNPLPQFVIDQHLIPLVKEWLVKIDKEKKTVVMVLPEGIL